MKLLIVLTSTNIKFHENRPVGAELHHAERDRYDEANSRFSQFC